jgi:hypothetical protein
MTLRHLLLSLDLILCSVLCACTSFDHRASSDVENELSRKDWAIARVRYAEQGRDLVLQFFDGRTEAVSVPCCARAEHEMVTRDRIMLVDLTTAPDPSSPTFERDLRRSGFGGPVVVMDKKGTVIERSEISVHAGLLALSPDEKSFAYLGVRLAHPRDVPGVYVAQFRGQEGQRLLTTDALPQDGALVRTSLDWSPDGRKLLFASVEGIRLIDVQTGAVQKVADGGAARWSPSGEWITYLTPRSEAMLFNLTTGEAKAIDPNRQVVAPVEWSPDGKYLLIREGEGSNVPYGCYWAYRISDSSWLPLQDLGVGGLLPNWVKLEGERAP